MMDDGDDIRWSMDGELRVGCLVVCALLVFPFRDCRSVLNESRYEKVMINISGRSCHG